MLKKRLLFGILVLSLVLTLAGFAAEDFEWLPAPEYIEIGSINAFTGPQAISGEVMRRGHEVAVEKINAEGGIHGIPVRMVYEDGKGTNEGTVAALNKLIYDHQVMVALVTDFSSLNHAVAPLAARAEIPVLYGGTAWSLRELKNPWMFGSRTNDRLNSAIMAKFIVEKLGHTKIAALYSDETFGQGGYEWTSRALKENYGIEPLTAQKFARGTKDYTAQLLAIKRSGATCIFSWSTNPEDDGIILRQMRQLGLDVDLVGNSSFSSLAITVRIAGEDAEGIYSICDYTVAQGGWSKYLNDELMKKYGEPADSDMQWPYDTTLVIAEALRNAGIIREINGRKMIMPVKQADQAIREALLNIRDFNEGTTKTYHCDEYQDLAHSMVIVRITNGQHEFIESVEYGV